MTTTTFFKYLQFEKRFSTHTLLAYKVDLQQFKDYLHTTYELSNAQEVTSQHIRSWMVHLMQKGLTTRTVNRKLSALKSYFKFLKKRGHLDANPMAKIIAPKIAKRLPVFVQKDQIEMLFDTVDFGEGYDGIRNRSIMELLYATGMRRAELISLKVSDISFANNHIKVIGKGNKERLIPMNPKIEKVLKSYLFEKQKYFPTQSYLFLTRKGEKMYPKLVYNLVNKYLSFVTTLEQRSPHVLRHTFATHLSDNGADLNAIKDLLGHASLAATQVYTHNSIEKLKKAYEQAHPKAKKS
ncbi:MAG TPA: integrase [Phaeodactylibacter sp.]|nr:integrase [Phaeodactylibacter sp.]